VPEIDPKVRYDDIVADAHRRLDGMDFTGPAVQEHYFRLAVVAQAAWDLANAPEVHPHERARNRRPRLAVLRRAVFELRHFEREHVGADRGHLPLWLAPR
jgi:predicted type IV restriction endonuclease